MFREEEVSFMIARMDVMTDVARLYDVAASENVLIEIELDTQQLRALTEEEVRLLRSEDLAAGHPDTQNSATPGLNDSLEALLRLSWPVWKSNTDTAIGKFGRF
jgi:hypothetical protein